MLRMIRSARPQGRMSFLAQSIRNYRAVKQNFLVTRVVTSGFPVAIAPFNTNNAAYNSTVPMRTGRLSLCTRSEVDDEMEEIARAEQALQEGDVDLALSELERALEIVKRSYSPADPRTKNVLLSLSTVCQGIEHTERAAALLERYLFEDGFHDQLQGLPDGWQAKVLVHEGTIDQLHALSACYVQLERFAEAIQITKFVRESFKEDKDLLAQASAEVEISQVYYLAGQEAKAEKWLRRADRHSEKIARDDMECSAELDSQIGTALEDRDPARALPFFMRAAGKLEQLLDQERDETQRSQLLAQFYDSLLDIASCHSCMENFDAAKDHLERALKIARDVEGEENNRHAAWCLRALGKLYDDFDQNAVFAEGFYKSALSMYEGVDAEEAEEVYEEYTTLLSDMVDFYHKRGRREDAAAMRDKLRQVTGECDDDEALPGKLH